MDGHGGNLGKHEVWRKGASAVGKGKRETEKRIK